MWKCPKCGREFKNEEQNLLADADVLARQKHYSFRCL